MVLGHSDYLNLGENIERKARLAEHIQELVVALYRGGNPLAAERALALLDAVGGFLDLPGIEAFERDEAPRWCH